ncbi:hypothetical protein ADIARSV_0339 [Arcticibacter svalbardensis MN12-7]|uniref:DUF72 domain-containing protein n=1 Tax=Arcticibacter svalbardensis MN12-7 TaxID=1150600 RepID=R9GXE2_9SPHI|nr:DUF72 domain-containing protein [Arcticibacter svalbardensis]EOR96436.1 hypothetical protein ADIARSV_0339 [Arcticibacter svalbardensis MN12-7]
MDFGKVPENELAGIDFTLPADSVLTTAVLKQAKALKDLPSYIGCAKWGRKEWKGLIYPDKLKDILFLNEYVKHFNSIELNAVFYKVPEKDQIITWREKAEAKGAEFKFCPKISQTISHIKRLKNAEEATSKYLSSIMEFGKYLGPSFLQLSDNFGPANLQVLSDYLESLPKDFDLFVEVRHQGWYTDVSARKEYFDMLSKHHVGAVITDASGRRDCVHMELPTPHAFIRFVGNSLHPTDYKRVDEWIDRIAEWKKQGLQSAWFFLHQHDEKDTPILADYTVKKWNEVLGTELAGPGIRIKPTELGL